MLEYSTRLEKNYSTRTYSSNDFGNQVILDLTRLENSKLANIRMYSNIGKKVKFKVNSRNFGKIWM